MGTAIKVLVGEQKPTEGQIWKAAGLRMAYVAQHAFHHLEKHMTETPTQYIMWRFAGNDDKESIEFKSTELSVDEEAARAAKWCIDGVTGNVRRCIDPKEDAKKAKADEAGAVVPDAVVNRRQKKKEKTYEHEVKWQFKPMESNCWVEKEILVKMGYLRIEGESVAADDEKDGGNAGPDEVYDGAGNRIDVKKNVTLSDKDKKKQIKDIEKKLKEGKKT